MSGLAQSGADGDPAHVYSGTTVAQRHQACRGRGSSGRHQITHLITQVAVVANSGDNTAAGKNNFAG